LILGISCRTKFIFLDEPLDGIDVINTKIIVPELAQLTGALGAAIFAYEEYIRKNKSERSL